MKKCMQCGGSTKRMQKGGALSPTGAKIGLGVIGSGAAGMIGNMIGDAIKKRRAKKAIASKNPKAITGSGSTAKLEKKQKGGMPTRVLGPAKKPFAAGIPFFTGSGQTGPEYMKKGGSFAPNRAVQTSCKNGTVRDASGRCVMQRKMSKGGFPDLNRDGKVTKADVLKGRGVIKRKGGAVKKR